MQLREYRAAHGISDLVYKRFLLEAHAKLSNKAKAGKKRRRAAKANDENEDSAATKKAKPSNKIGAVKRRRAAKANDENEDPTLAKNATPSNTLEPASKDPSDTADSDLNRIEDPDSSQVVNKECANMKQEFERAAEFDGEESGDSDRSDGTDSEEDEVEIILYRKKRYRKKHGKSHHRWSSGRGFW